VTRWQSYCEAIALEQDALALAHQMRLLALTYDDQGYRDPDSRDASARHHERLIADYTQRAAEWRQMGASEAA